MRHDTDFVLEKSRLAPTDVVGAGWRESAPRQPGRPPGLWPDGRPARRSPDHDLGTMTTPPQPSIFWSNKAAPKRRHSNCACPTAKRRSLLLMSQRWFGMARIILSCNCSRNPAPLLQSWPMSQRRRVPAPRTKTRFRPIPIKSLFWKMRTGPPCWCIKMAELRGSIGPPCAPLARGLARRRRDWRKSGRRRTRIRAGNF